MKIYSIITKNELIIFALFILITLIMLANHLPPLSKLHKEMVGGDARIQAYVLAWDNMIILKDPLKLFDANIFYPHKRTLAYTHHLFATSLLSFPIYHLTKNPVLAYNLVYIFIFVMSAFSMYLLSNYYFDNRYAAFIAGLIFAFSQNRFLQQGHMSLLVVQWMPLTILFFHKLCDYNSYKYAILFGIFFLLHVLSDWYVAVFLGIILILLFFNYLILSRRNEFSSSIIKNLIVNLSVIKKLVYVLFISLILILPFAIPYYNHNKTEHFEDSVSNLIYQPANSATFLLYLLPFPGTTLFQFIHKYDYLYAYTGEQNASLGIFPIMLSLIAIISLIKKAQDYEFDYEIRRTTKLYIFLGLFALILSLGPFLQLFGKITSIPLPYYFIHKYIPLLTFIRSPSRFALLITFSLSILGGIGALKLLGFTKKKMILTIVTSSLILGESFCLSGDVKEEVKIPAVYTWLSKQEVRGLIELPMYAEKDDPKNADYYWYSTVHWKNLLNGFANRRPKEYFNLEATVRNFPSDSSLCYLKKSGASHIIVHAIDSKAYGISLGDVLKNKYLELLKQENDIYLFKLKDLNC